MTAQTQDELERKMAERIGILPKKHRFVGEINPYARARGHIEELKVWPAIRATDVPSDFVVASLATDVLSDFVLVSSMEKNPLVKRIEYLEKTIRDLMRAHAQKEIEKVFSKADLVYYKFKDELEKEHFGKIAAIDVDSEKIVAIGNSILEAYSEAKKNSPKKQFSYRRVGFDFVHRL